jgi:hypothetical protein
MTRVRIRDRRFGGGQRLDFGPGRIDEPIDLPAPALERGAQTTDQVRQLTAGIGYEGRSRHVGEASLGIQRTFYQYWRRLLLQCPPPLSDESDLRRLSLPDLLSRFFAQRLRKDFHALTKEKQGRPAIGLNRAAPPSNARSAR